MNQKMKNIVNTTNFIEYKAKKIDLQLKNDWYNKYSRKRRCYKL